MQKNIKFVGVKNLPKIIKTKVTTGVIWVEVPEAGMSILCGCPEDAVKHLMQRGFIQTTEKDGVQFETGPNAILLSDLPIQNGAFCNLSEFPVLQMLYRQGMLLPDHPNNTGVRPLLLGSEGQVRAQMQYIYRGNYGLTSKAEIMATGMSAADAELIMDMKSKFAFGNIRATEELLDSHIIDAAPKEIRGGVMVSASTPIFLNSPMKTRLSLSISTCPRGKNTARPIRLDSRTSAANISPLSIPARAMAGTSTGPRCHPYWFIRARFT